MKIDVSCLSCLVKQLSGTIQLLGIEDSIAKDYAKKVLEMISHEDLDVPPPLMAKKIYKMLSELTGENDPYKEIKRQSNILAIKIVKDLKEVINSEEESEQFATAAKIVISGNIIDYGVNSDINDDVIIKEIQSVNQKEVDPVSLKSFEKSILNSKNVFYIGDNAGEVVLDKYFIDNYLSHADVTYAVRGNPIINDSIMEDALFVEMDKSAAIVTTGDGTPGIDFDNTSQDFFEKFKTADMVILKGQGNYETAYREDLKQIISSKINSKFDKPVYFLFKVKCPLVSEISGYPMGTHMLLEL